MKTFYRPRVTTPSFGNSALQLAFLLLCLMAIVKGFRPSVHVDEIYFWFTSYKDGIARRSLVGSVTAPILSTLSNYHIMLALRLITLFAVIYLLKRLWEILRSLTASLPVRDCFLLAGLVTASPFLSLIVYHVGYPDVLIAILVVIGQDALQRKSVWTCVIALALATLVHEATLLMLGPFVVWSYVHRRDWTTRNRWLVVIGFAGCCLLTVAAGHVSSLSLTDLRLRLDAVGFPQQDARRQADAFLTQGVLNSVLMMRRMWAAYGVNMVFETLYATLPGILILLVGFHAAPSKFIVKTQAASARAGTILLYACCGLSPLLLLAIAFDVSRLASFSTLTALFTLNNLSADTFSQNGHRRPITPLLFFAVPVYLACPVLDLHPWYAQPVNVGLMRMLCSPCSRMALVDADFLNRHWPVENRQKFDSDPDYGN